MRPTSTSVILRPDLNAFAYEYQEAEGRQLFIGQRVAPVFNSLNKSGQYEYATRASFRKRSDTKRAPNGAYNQITGGFAQGTFTCKERGLEYPVDDEKVNQWGSVFNAEVAATQILRRQLMMDHEAAVASAITGASLTNHNVTTAWSTVATAVPLTDILTGCFAIQKKTGIPRSMMSVVIPLADFLELIETTQVKNKLQYTYQGTIPAMVTAVMVAAMLEVKEVLIGQSTYDSAAEDETEVDADFWTAGVCYIMVCAPANSGWNSPSAARTILWTGDSPQMPTIESYWSDERRATIVRQRENTSEKMTMETDLLAYQLTNT